MNLFTVTRSGTEPLPFTLPTIQEASVPEPTPSEIIPSEDDSNEIPKWVKDIFSFYSEGLINDDELIGALQFLIRSGIIQI